MLCIDEKTQIKALDRNQPLLRMGLGSLDSVTHLHPPRHHHPVRRLGRSHRRGAHAVQASPPAPGVPWLPGSNRDLGPRRSRRPPDRGQDLHPQARQGSCLACAETKVSCAQHPHLRPWLSQVEGWLGIITLQAIWRGSFSSVKGLVAEIKQFVKTYTKTKSPLNWTVTTVSILEKPQRLYSQITGTVH